MKSRTSHVLAYKHLSGYSSQNIPNFTKCVYFLSFTRIYMYILLTVTVQKIKPKIKLKDVNFAI